MYTYYVHIRHRGKTLTLPPPSSVYMLPPRYPHDSTILYPEIMSARLYSRVSALDSFCARVGLIFDK